MRYINKTTNQVVWIHEIRNEFPNMSIPNDADLTELGYVKLIEAPAPVQAGYDAVEIAPVNNTQNWELRLRVVDVPQVLTPRQIRKVLTDSGLRTAVENMVAASTDYDLKDWWEYSLSYERTHPKLIEAAYALSLTDAQIDGMFVIGGAL